MLVPGSANPLLASATTAVAGYQISRSLRFNSSDSAYLSRTPASAGNRKTWTWSGWVKRASGAGIKLLRAGTSLVTNPITTGVDFGDQIFIIQYDYPTATWGLDSVAVFRDYSAWYHVVISVDTTQATAANRVRLYVNGVQQSLTQRSGYSSAYPAQNSDTWVNSANAHEIASSLDAYLAECIFIDGQALTPSSFGQFDANGEWQPIAYTGTYGTNGFKLNFADNSAATAAALGKDTSPNGNNWTPNNLSVINNTQRWSRYFSVVGSGSSNVNGTELQAFDSDISTSNGYSGALLPSNYLLWSSPVTFTNAAVRVRVSQGNLGTGTLEVNGVSRTITNAQGVHWEDFGTLSTFNSIKLGLDSQPTNGTYIYAVEVNGSILVDSVFNYGNDSLVDTPTSYGTDTGVGGEVRGNYATLNPLQSSTTLSNGNLDAYTTSTSWQANVGTIFQSSGKWYAEVTVTSQAAGGGVHIGIVGPDYSVAAGNYIGNTATSYAYRSVDALKYNNGTYSSYGTAYGIGDIIGVAMDLDAGTIAFYKNGTSQGTAYTGLTGPKAFAVSLGGTTGTFSGSINFGQRPFAYTAPSGFKALCDTNLPAPVVAKPNTVMDVKLYTGNGGTQTISGLGFSPDFVWIKDRASGVYNHLLFDQVRGVNKYLSSSSTMAEGGLAGEYLTSFTSDGFALASQAGVNASPNAHVAWCWDAGSSNVVNTQGTITSTVRANPSAGFSIVTTTTPASGASTVGHGLGVAPSLIITKFRSTANNWFTYHSSLGNSSYVSLESTAAVVTSSAFWNNTSPTSTVFSLGSVWATSNTLVAYCFAPVAGYSSFGSYTGNGSADGPFVYTGFRPRWVMIKVVNATGNGPLDAWLLYDSARDTYNVATKYLYANSSQAEGSYAIPDFCSNGFKIRASTTESNQNGNTYIYAAFAENPFQYARAR